MNRVLTVMFLVGAAASQAVANDSSRSEYPAPAFDPTRPFAMSVKKAPDNAGALSWLERGQYFARRGAEAPQSNR
jgi:hypothetical protein